jgi:hypothetical protein
MRLFYADQNKTCFRKMSAGEMVTSGVVSVPNFLSVDETNYLLHVARSIAKWDSRVHAYWDGRVMSMFAFGSRVEDSESFILLAHEIVERLSAVIRDNYGVSELVFVDCLDLVRWPVGSELTPHIDEVPHAHRLWGSVIYLNDDYEGGETFYPNLGVSVSPQAGMAVVHRGDEEHRHGVTKVSGVERFTIASFWGVDRSHALQETLI